MVVGLGQRLAVPVAGDLAEEVERVRAPALELLDQRPRERERVAVPRVEPLKGDPPGGVVAAVGDPVQYLAVGRVEVVVRAFRGDGAMVKLSSQPEGLMDLESDDNLGNDAYLL